MKNNIKLWKYKHYKWILYEVIWIWFHSETLEEMVFYKALYDSKDFWQNTFWCRPKNMFFENVEINWILKPRFEYIWD